LQETKTASKANTKLQPFYWLLLTINYHRLATTTT